MRKDNDPLYRYPLCLHLGRAQELQMILPILTLCIWYGWNWKQSNLIGREREDVSKTDLKSTPRGRHLNFQLFIWTKDRHEQCQLILRWLESIAIHWIHWMRWYIDMSEDNYHIKSEGLTQVYLIFPSSSVIFSQQWFHKQSQAVPTSY